MAQPPCSLVSQIKRGVIGKDDYLPPDLPKKTTKRDWVKITAIAVLVIAGLTAAFAGLTLSGMFPAALFGGSQNALFTLFGAGVIAAWAGEVFYYKWKTAG